MILSRTAISPFGLRGSSIDPYAGEEIGSYLSKTWTGSGSLTGWTTVATTSTFTPGAAGLAITGGDATFNQYIKYDSIYTAIEKYNMEMVFIATENSATSTGCWLGTVGATTLGNYCRFICSTGVNEGKVNIYSGTGSSLVQSASGVVVNAGDRIRLTFNRNQQVLTVTAENLTAGGSTSATYTIALTSAEVASIPSTAQFAIGNMRGTQTIESLSITSESLKNTWINFIGDSITNGKFAGSIADRFANQTMAASSKAYQVCGGPGDRTAQILNRMPEILLMNPRYVVLSVGKNDVRAGVASGTYTANYTSIRNQLNAAGITAIHLLSTPEGALSLTTLNNHINSMNTTYGDLVIDVATPVSSSPGVPDPAKFNADLIHPNNLGHADMGSTIATAISSIL